MFTEELRLNFENAIGILADSAHGVDALEQVKVLMKRIKKEERVELLAAYLFRTAIVWDEVKNVIWPDETLRNKNKFDLLQGDIIETTMVARIGSAMSGSKHDLWMVLSPDCDCVRSPFITVAPIFFSDSTLDGEDAIKRNKDNFSLSLALGTLKFFPVSKCLFGDHCEHYYADFTEPYFLHESNKASVTVHFSMRKHGWHILNALVKHKDSRAVDREEGERLRDHVHIPSPEIAQQQ